MAGVFLFGTQVVAQQGPTRFALLIGNQSYKTSVGELKNPHNDIALVSQALASQGFKVLPLLKDATRGQILAAVRDLVRHLNAAGSGAVGFLYYSGHGAAEAVTKRNYLISIDAQKPGTGSFWDESVQLDEVLSALSGASAAAKFVVFDACRNELRVPYRGSKGFEPVREQPGIYVAYATAPGQPALDTGEASGPYAAALAAEFAKPGLDHLSLFQNVKEAVYTATKGAQAPWESNGLIRRVYLTGEPKPSPSKPIKAAQAWGVQIVTAPQASEGCDGLLVSVAQPRAKPCIKLGSGESFKDCPECPEMVLIPAGNFLMGSPQGEEGQSADEGPQHEVKIRTPFAVGRTHITRGEWALFVEATGYKSDGGCWTWTGRDWKENKSASWRSPGFEQDDSHPAICVSWSDAKAYVAWLSETTGKEYRLLSEAEAEYVARGVTVATKQTPFFFGEDAKELCRYANGADETAKAKFANWIVAPCEDGYVFTAPVMSFKSNPFGLYDVHGNVWSWVEDCWHDNYDGAPVDGSVWTAEKCKYRVLRGGSWKDSQQTLHAAHREFNHPGDRYEINGLRVARTLNP